MKNFKINFPLLVAILIVAFTITAKANIVNGKRIIGCFSGVEIQNFSGSLYDTPVYNSTACVDVHLWLSPITPFVNRLQYIKSLPSPVDRTNEICESTIDFCCLIIEEIQNPDDFPSVPTVNFGDGAKKYHITGFLCRP